MSHGQKFDGGAAGFPLALNFQQVVEHQAISLSREQAIAIDQPKECHGLSAQRMDHVTVIDNVAVLPVHACASARQGHESRAANEDVEAVIIKASPQTVPDQAGWDRVQHLAQREATRGCDRHEDLLVIGGAHVRQRP
nr:hypothetical protein TQ38_16335 [Novosphingobium sp. P6W]